MMTFGERLQAAASERGRLCVGIDPHEHLLEQWGLPSTVDGLREFCRLCVEAFADSVALVKPQVAFFERFGAAGFQVLEETIGRLREGGALVLADAKRGDIGSTMAGYARAWLDPAAPLACDAVTLSPYLGLGSLQPAFQLAVDHGGGIFVLAATSNPEAPSIQQAHDAEGRSIAQQIVDGVARINASCGDSTVGSIGVVVGATVSDPPQLSHLGGPVLLPGVGAQGAGAGDVSRICAGVDSLAFPTMSRGILRAGPDISALREAVQEASRQFPA